MQNPYIVSFDTKVQHWLLAIIGLNFSILSEILFKNITFEG